MGDSLVWIFRNDPSTYAIWSPQGQVTYRELLSKVEQFSYELNCFGLGGNKIVAIRPHRTAKDIIAILACLRVGLIPCLINPLLPEEKAQLCMKTGGVQGELMWVNSSLSFDDITYKVFDEWTSADRNLFLPSPSVIVFTSGSLGEPKAAVLSLKNLLYNASLSNQILPISVGDRWLLSLPLCHVSGLGIVFRTLLAGGTIAIAERGAPLEQTITKLGISHLSVIPSQLWKLMQCRDLTGIFRGNLKHILVGGAPISEKLIREALKLNLPIHTSYGLTEMSSQVCTTRTGEELAAISSCGAPLEEGTVDIDEAGEIHVRGECLFIGYYRDSCLVRPLNQGGWFATGDLGKWDQYGRLCFLGRRDLLFRCQGEFVSPEEIERELLSSGIVEAAVVVGVPEPEVGYTPVAFIRLMEDQQNFFEDKVSWLRGFLREKLPSFKLPSYFFPLLDEENQGLKPSRQSLFNYATQVLEKQTHRL